MFLPTAPLGHSPGTAGWRVPLFQPCGPGFGVQSGASEARSALGRTPLLLYGYGLGIGLFACYLAQRPTIAVQVDGLENLEAESNYIFCHWHGCTPLSLQGNVPRLASFLSRRPHVWMQHPSWYMKPIHVLLRLIGVKKLVLGSTGHRGRDAADELVKYLRSGYSTVLLPDGPGGPPRVLKKGILHMALQSNVPIVPLHVTASRCVTTRSWDRKQYPVPFSALRIHVCRPITVTERTFHEAERGLRQALG